MGSFPEDTLTETHPKMDSQTETPATVASQSQFIQRVDDIPMVHNTIDFLLSTYGVIKDVNPTLKSSLEKSEDVAYWLSQKAGDAVVATKLDAPLKRLDSAAAGGIDHVEKKISETNDSVQAKIKEGIKGGEAKIYQGAGMAREAMFDGVQKMLDFVEDKCEPIIVKSDEAAKETAVEHSVYNTAARTFDLTYRLNLGILKASAMKAKEFAKTQQEVMSETYQKHSAPAALKQRAKVISEVAMAKTPEEVKGVDINDLPGLDRHLIALSRYVIDTGDSLATSAKEAPGKVATMVKGSFSYVGGVLRHIGEARSTNDLLGISLNESRRLMEGARDNVAVINNFGVLDGLIQWTASKESAIQKS